MVFKKPLTTFNRHHENGIINCLEEIQQPSAELYDILDINSLQNMC